jgi:two-component system response regulator YesN
MKNLLNHMELAFSIRNVDLENANNIYRKKIKLLLSFSQEPHELKKLLYSINTFIYTYFCMNMSLTLDDLCYKNIQLIDTYDLKDDLIYLGEDIIKSYIEIIGNNETLSTNEIVKQAVIYINSNLEKKLTLEKVATHIHISSNYLCYLFKENTGCKFCEYINICRINLAKEFLHTTSTSLEALSFKCGFNSQSHFCTTFKKYVGASPNEYRKRKIT